MEKKENYKVINGGLKNENNINTRYAKKNTALLDKIKNWITYKAKKMTNAKKRDTEVLGYWIK